MKEKIKIIAKRADRPDPYVTNISNNLKNLQNFVGGNIEFVRVFSDCGIICNEEGLLLGLPENCNILGHYFVGDLFFVGVDGEDFTDCPLSLDLIKGMIRG